MNKTIHQKAQKIISEITEWPEDDWISIDENYDLNIFIDGDGNKSARIYQVVNGETIINEKSEKVKL